MTTARIFIKKDYVAMDGTVPIYLRITHNRKVFPPIKLNKRITPEQWDDTMARPRPEHPNFEKLKRLLDKIQRQADDIILDHEISGRVMTAQSFAREFAGLSPFDFYYLAERYIESVKPRLSEPTIQKITLVVGKLKRFAPALNLSAIDYAFVEKYMNYLAADVGNGANTINGNIKILRRIFRYGMKLRLVKENPFMEVKLSHIKTERDSLTLQEYKQYEELLGKGLPVYLENTLIWFLLACCTGRRFEDMQMFDSWEFTHDYVKIVQMKRVNGRSDRKVILLYLNDRIRRLVAMVRERQLRPIGPASRKFLLSINGVLGMRKHITFHSARHTFANINKQLTDDLTIRRDLLGHDSIKSTLIYDHVNPDMLRDAMLKWDSL